MIFFHYLCTGTKQVSCNCTPRTWLLYYPYKAFILPVYDMYTSFKHDVYEP